MTIQVVLQPGERAKLVDKSRKKMDEVCMRIVQEKKAAILAEMGGEKIDKHNVAGHDVISLLLRANLAADVEPSMRLSDEEVLAQIPTFLVAGMTRFIWSKRSSHARKDTRPRALRQRGRCTL